MGLQRGEKKTMSYFKSWLSEIWFAQSARKVFCALTGWWFLPGLQTCILQCENCACWKQPPKTIRKRNLVLRPGQKYFVKNIFANVIYNCYLCPGIWTPSLYNGDIFPWTWTLPKLVATSLCMVINGFGQLITTAPEPLEIHWLLCISMVWVVLWFRGWPQNRWECKEFCAFP